MDVVVIKGIFLKYILLPLIVVVLAIVLGYMKRQVPKIKGRVLIVYILLAGLCLALPGFLGFSGNMFNPFWYLLSMMAYLLLGVIHVNLINSYFNDSSRPLWFVILFESLITVTCMLFGGYLFYLIFNWTSPFEGYAAMASTSITIFIVPLSFYYCYIQYINIPFDIYKTWQHSFSDAAVDFDKIEFRTLLLLNLELTKTIADGKKSRIDAKAPSDGLSVGGWFYRVVDDYNHKYPNSPIQLLNPEKEPYSWIFYTKKSLFHFRKFIDFDKTMSENDITEHTTIICKRVINNEIEDKNIKKY
ncbi:MAG TPA: TssN family type VI secretion system protein [Flavobacterium sp.]|nr:TssN family type VI secretion system protein [Flavobacterium sp.]